MGENLVLQRAQHSRRRHRAGLVDSRSGVHSRYRPIAKGEQVNPVLMLTRNNLALTQKAVVSAQLQDIPCSVHIIDNGSTDDTIKWAGDLVMDSATFNAGVSAGWNHGLAQIFERHDHCLVINNDVILPRWFYGELLS